MRYVEAYTGITAFHVEDPLDAWIIEFFRSTKSEDRLHFAQGIGQVLECMDDDGQRSLWDSWLKCYWELRSMGFIGKLEGPEWEAMLRWLLYFKSLFPEAAECAIQMPNFSFESDSIVFDFNERMPWSQYPVAAAKILIYLHKSEKPLWFWV